MTEQNRGASAGGERASGPAVPSESEGVHTHVSKAAAARKREAGDGPEARLFENPHKGALDPTRLWNALGYALAGIRAAFRHEYAFRAEVLACAVLTPIALFVEPSGIGRALLIGSILMVLMVELINSAIEAAVDRISYEEHALAKRAKDMGSGAVFVSLVNAAVVWACILL